MASFMGAAAAGYPTAALIDVAMYSNAAGTIPIVEAPILVMHSPRYGTGLHDEA
jgi:hypothetical protein